MLARVKDAKGKDNGSRLEHLNNIWRMSGRKPKELEFEMPDDDVLYLLSYYYEMKRGAALTYSEVRAYCDSMSIELSAWECRAIMRLDTIFESSAHGI